MEAIAIFCLGVTWFILSMRVLHVTIERFKLISFVTKVLAITFIHDENSRSLARTDRLEETGQKLKETQDSQKIDFMLIALTTVLMIVGIVSLLFFK